MYLGNSFFHVPVCSLNIREYCEVSCLVKYAFETLSPYVHFTIHLHMGLIPVIARKHVL
jgi:hypothetical protein